MNRLQTLFERQGQQHRKTLSFFLTGGFPRLDATVPLIRALEHAGADLIELGVPFSDPIADGPTIQRSSDIALANGTTLDHLFSIVREVRTTSSIPIILMGYANPVLAYGVDAFLRACSDAGVDGLIIPDFPLEEGNEFRVAANASGLATILLVTPTTPPDRLAAIDQASSGFLYCVSVTGVTGKRANLRESAGAFLASLRRSVRRNPVLVGFGIATPEDARAMAADSDGVIIGSALLDLIAASPDGSVEPAVTAFAREMRKAIDAEKVIA